MEGTPYDCPQKPFGGDEDYSWSPDGKKVLYVTKKLAGTDYAVSTNTDIYEYDIASKVTTNLTEENKGSDTHPVFSSKGTLAWLQMKRDGYESDKNDIIVQLADGKLNLTQDWDGLIPGLNVRKFDAIIASMSITEERLKVVDFSDKYYSGGLRYMGRVGDAVDVNDLSGKTVGAQRATIAAQYLEDNLADKIDLKLYDNQDNVYLDLVSGRLDIVLSDELPTYNWLKTAESGSKFEFKGEAFMKNDEIGIAVRKSDGKLKAKINEALAEIIADGTYQKINAKYFPFSIY